MQKIRVTIENDGSTTVETTGFQGSTCIEATAELQAALGVVEDTTKKPEFYVQTTENQQQLRSS